MAKVQQQSIMRPGKQFSSVFPPRSVKPPKQYHKFESKARSYGLDVHKTLLDSSRVILGIGDEDFTFGLDSSVAQSEVLYRTYYASCPGLAFAQEPTDADYNAQRSKYARLKLWNAIREWQQQLGGDYVRKALAGVLDKLITEFVSWAYFGVYEEGVIPHLRFWVAHIFARYVIQFLGVLRACESDLNRVRTTEISHTELQRWQDMAMSRLGTLRVDELFDIIVDWDETQHGIEDLRHFATNPATRSYLTSNFANVLSTRLLHPGASTIEILQLYISIIRAFRKLDPKGVLLDRVARLIRRYLRDRDDTVKAIVNGLLSDAFDADGDVLPPSTDTLTELALELSRRDAESSKDDEGEFDWNSMEWVPDPIDAAPDYMKSKNTDVIGSLMSLFESKDVFVKELQATLADRLLRNKTDFDQEISVLEHLKIRFGDAALQACEVMLRDVLDSRKVDNIIRQDQGMETEEQGSDSALHAKILSRLFWPTLQDQAYKIPRAILEQQVSYEKGFEALKQSRKLTWLNAIGQVEVELDLEDRVYHDEVLPWQAAVIYAFQPEGDDISENAPPVSKSIAQLAESLEMSPTLVRSACIFWTSKRILVESPKDTYTVLESLPDGDEQSTSDIDGLGRPDAASAAVEAAEAAQAQASKEAEEEERQTKMAMYNQFVISMLTNQGAMPLPRIAMMLGIVVPGGFPFSNEELKEFLGVLVREGRLEIGHGGAYKVI